MLTEEEIKALQDENAALKTSIGDLTTSTTSMKNKMDQLLSETKTAKDLARVAEEEKTKAISDKALKDGNFEELYKASEAANATLKTDYNGLLDNIATKDRNSLASKIANQIAEGTNAEILSDYIGKRLKSTDDGIKILSETGELTVSTAEDLATEFKGNARFSSLVMGNQSSGGGATGGQNSSGAAKKTMNRNDFDAMSPVEKSAFVRDGGMTTDE